MDEETLTHCGDCGGSLHYNPTLLSWDDDVAEVVGPLGDHLLVHAQCYLNDQALTLPNWKLA